MYLEAPPTSCYCDDSCTTLGDCCPDYAVVCPPQECVVSNWGEWEGCVADDGICGLGVEQRVRHVTQQSARGGTPCPPLKEMRTCFKLCSKRRSLDDITTVALLLDYRHNETRSKKSRNNIYWDMPSVYEKLKQTTSYCVKYKIGWVNRNCWHKQITMRLYRCASDLEDGEQGFWKLIGPKSCNGIWTRISRDDNCHCGRNHTELDPFLLV
ncbi:unnamed protein product [Angiostrongylus costaricensis]|uniref:SMB domain-containing protein n=1 Tax=Angiostrongylus costaricensis TaxID=334426 RepID=A0A0R3PMQ2_ANGCS|nr:unnamed protein product [Angiostrongylus costaricensis]